MSRLNASPTKGSPTKGSPSPTKSGASVPTVGNGTNLVNCVSNAAFTKLAERSRAGSASSTRPGTPASPRPSSPVKALTGGKTPVVTLGVCAMDVKARSKAMREILTRLVDIEKGGVDVQIFGDVVILEEDINHWPQVDVLISFFSTDFPLPKALAYTQIPNRLPPISINSLAMQSLLWDRRLVLAILDHIGVPTPKRAEVNRDGGPRVPRSLRLRVRKELGLVLPGHKAKDEDTWDPVVVPERWQNKTHKVVPRSRDVILREDGDAIIVGDAVIEKPFVEKPVNGEDHNVYIYYRGGGGRRLFRKVGNKSSEYDASLYHPRTVGSFIYEEFINVDNAEDVKVYTIGPEFSHAETRKSPVVDGLVQRNADGKETRFITKLSPQEESYAKDVVEAFGQRVCGFDLLRDKGRSMVIDVNGWSFVKGNQSYYDKAAEILSAVCDIARERKIEQQRLLMPPPDAQQSSTSTLRATVTVLRHADRTPKMKLKFSFPAHEAWARPFLSLLRGYREEIILRDPRQLNYILLAADEAKKIDGVTPEIVAKLDQLKEVLTKKMNLPGTKAQLKPSFVKKGSDKDKSKDDKKEKKDKKDKKEEVGSGDEDDEASRQRVDDWLKRGSVGSVPAGEKVAVPADAKSTLTTPADSKATSATDTVPQTPDMRAVITGETESYGIPEGLEKMQLVVKWGGESTHAARYQARDLGDAFKKDILIMNKDVLSNVKIYTSSERRVINTAHFFAHSLLGAGDQQPATTTPTANRTSGTPVEPSGPVISHLIQRRDLLDDNNAGKEKIGEAKKKLKMLLRSGETEKRSDLQWSLKEEPVEVVREVIAQLTELRAIMRANYENGNVDRIPKQRWCSGDSPWLFRERWEKIFEDWVGVKQEKFDPSRVSELYDSIKYDSLHNRNFLFAVFDPEGKGLSSRTGAEHQDRRLHELYARAKALFDLVAPQEYGFDAEAKEEIGILTSLPLLRKVWGDLEEAKNTGKSSACFYFTKESHITTFVHLLLASGLPFATNVRIPELDYCSHITIELWEKSSQRDGKTHKDFSIRLSISEGAHSPAVLDSNVDARHSLTVQPRRKLTSHVDWALAEKCLVKHFGKGLTFSTTPLEGDQVYLKKAVHDEAVLPLSLSRGGEDTPRGVMSSASSHRSATSDAGW